MPKLLPQPLRLDLKSFNFGKKKYLKKIIRAYNQGMYKNMVKNDRKIFEIPTFLSCKQGNPERENSK